LEEPLKHGTELRKQNAYCVAIHALLQEGIKAHGKTADNSTHQVISEKDVVAASLMNDKDKKNPAESLSRYNPKLRALNIADKLG
jgi:hypothetical protein